MSTEMISCVPTREAGAGTAAVLEEWVTMSPSPRGEHQAQAVRAVPVATRVPAQAERSRRTPLRRLRGFLQGTEGRECTVVFVDGDQTYPYRLPADQLRKAGVKAPNQPFEMDEVEITGPDGEPGMGYIFRATARPQDAFADRVSLDSGRESRVSLIRKKLRDAQA
jgi:hypothetical protein